MRILFATAAPYLPEEFGGAEASVDELIRVIAPRGCTCEVVAGVKGRLASTRYGLWRLVTRRRRRALADRKNGYPTHRAFTYAVPAAFVERLRAFRPELVVCWNGACEEIAREALGAGVPVIVWVPDVTFDWYTGALPLGPRLLLAGSSAFVAERVRERLGVPSRVLRPLIRLDDYRAQRPRPEYVTLVNPRPHKGLQVALRAAALLPHRPFLFVEGGTSTRSERALLVAGLRALPNVRVERRVASMRSVYARTRVLLVPSQCEDASPRVVLEAQVNGIPVVASRTGGIPELLGESGELCDPGAPPERWAEAIERAVLLSHRADGAAAAIQNATRPELGPEAIAEGFVAMARDHLARAKG